MLVSLDCPTSKITIYTIFFLLKITTEYRGNTHLNLFNKYSNIALVSKFVFRFAQLELIGFVFAFLSKIIRNSKIRKHFGFCYIGMIQFVCFSFKIIYIYPGS